MRLDLLLNREDFVKVFNITFAKYLFNKFKWEGEVSWGRSGFTSSSGILLVNHKLNVIYSAKIDRDELSSIAGEYAYHPNFIRRSLQGIYIKLATCSVFESYLAESTICIDPWIDELDDICIIPGNHSVRIIELGNSECRVVLKDGFNKKFIDNEIKLRQDYLSLPIPQMIESNNKESWYVEQRVLALPLNRLDDKNTKDKAIIEAQAVLIDLYSLSSEPVKLNIYLESLLNLLNVAISELPNIYLEKDKSRIKDVVKFINGVVIISTDEAINIVQSHGDFQPANILVDVKNGQKLYLIDWEYSEKRSIFYDAFVFATESRFPNGLADRIRNIFYSEDLSSWGWCFGDTTRVELHRWMMALFLLEDLLVKLEELQIADLIAKSDGLNTWLSEVESMEWLFDE